MFKNRFITKNKSKCSLFLFFSLFLLISGLFIFPACQDDAADKPDVSGINVELEWKRFEQDLFNMDTLDISKSLSQIESKYPDFFPFYILQLMKFDSTGKNNKSIYSGEVLKFIQNKDIRELYDSVAIKYPQLEDINKDLTQAFKYFKHYFPEKNIPPVVSHLSVFGPACFTIDTVLLGLNLDMYLGGNSRFYSASGYPKYIRRRLDKAYVPSNLMEVYARELFPPSEKENRLIDQMMYEGKILYFLDLVLPDTPDSIKIAYTPEELEWCENSISNIWAYFIEEDMLYNSESRIFGRYLNEAPTTSGMPSESPGRIGKWLGWQIIKKFKKENPDVSFEQLMRIKDGQKILMKSKFKPERK